MSNLLYDSQAIGNDFDGSKSLSAIGFADANGGVASFGGGNLILTADASAGDAYLRDFVERAASQKDAGIQVTLPSNYITGQATLGIILRRQANNYYLLNFDRTASPPRLIIYKVVSGAVTALSTVSCFAPINIDTSVTLEAQVLLNPSRLLYQVRDASSGNLLGQTLIADSDATLQAQSGTAGIVVWNSGSVAVSRVQTYAVTAVVCDGNSLTAGQNASVGFNSGAGTGDASIASTNYPGQLQRFLGLGHHVVNAGRAGYTVTQMNSDAASRVDAPLASAERQPIVVIEGGTNDLGAESDLASLSASDAAQTVYGRLQTYYSARHAASPAPKVLALTPTPADHPAYASNLGSHEAFNQRRSALNVLILGGSGPNAVVNTAVDALIGLDGTEQDASYFSSDDKTHLTDAGYAIVAQYVAHNIDASIPLPASAQSAPVITSAATATGTVGTAFSYQITATGGATSYGASGLPRGLTLNTTTGIISGVLSSISSTIVSISATNTSGTGNAELNLTVLSPMPAPIITSQEEAQATATQPFQYQIEAENDPTSFAVNVLPTGLTLNPKSGLISGTPTVVNSSTITLTATNGFGSGTSQLELKVNAAPTNFGVTVTRNNIINYTQVAASQAAVNLLGENGHRKGAMLYNKSTANLLVLIGGTATLTNFSFIVPANALYEMFSSYYTDTLSGIWDAADANGYVNITEVSNSTLGVFNSGRFPY